MKFSERIGKGSPKTFVQIDSMDDDLKNSIWNVLYIYIFEPIKKYDILHHTHFDSLFTSIWVDFFKEPLHHMYDSNKLLVSNIRERYVSWDYLEIYDFIDFVSNENNYSSNDLSEFIQSLNNVFERELSGYRFIEGQLSPIINQAEIDSIEQSIKGTDNSKFMGVNIHLASALEKLSDRKYPDYRNSIKESISAVESICQVITGEEKTELSKTIKLIKDKIEIHPALEQGFLKLYNYTSDGDGIRHSLLEEENLGQEDAIYFLVTCSAFINYLIAKSKNIILETNKL